MTRVRQVRFRAAAAVLPVAGALLLALASMPAGATRGGFTDADDVSLALDLKAVSHTNDERSVTYTVETWQSFPDQQANFRWALVQRGAEAPDRVRLRPVDGRAARRRDRRGREAGRGGYRREAGAQRAGGCRSPCRPWGKAAPTATTSRP